METLNATIELKRYTAGDKVCAVTDHGNFAGTIDHYDAVAKTYTVATPTGEFVTFEEQSIKAWVNSAVLNSQPQAPTEAPKVGARTFVVAQPGSYIQDYTTYNTYNTVYAQAGSVVQIYNQRSSMVTLPQPPTCIKCTDEEKFWALWAGFYFNNPHYQTYTGIPTTTIYPSQTTIVPSGSVAVIRN